jgi:hypothetical protein
MRSISISTDVYARIWALRHNGEETEDQILKRVLFDRPESGQTVGFYDGRYGVAFPEGFSISRISKGRERRAEARGGKWWLEGVSYGSLNELSRTVTANSENAWKSWYFLDNEGGRHLIDSLRDRSTVIQRPPRSNLETKTGDDSMETWRDYVVNSLEQLGGRAHLDAIYRTVRELCASSRRRMPPSFEAVIRRTLEENSSDSDAFRTGNDIFCLPEGKGFGIWALRPR